MRELRKGEVNRRVVKLIDESRASGGRRDAKELSSSCRRKQRRVLYEVAQNSDNVSQSTPPFPGIFSSLLTASG